MGDHVYAHRGYAPYADTDTDDDHDDYYWKDKTYGGGGGGSGKVCRTYIVDGNGRQRTVVGCSPHYDTESYVQTEVTERFRSPMISSGYQHRSPKKYWSPSSPMSYYDGDGRPKEVNDFITGVQIEASRPNHYTPHNNGSAFGRPTVHPTTGYGGYGGYRNGNDYGGDSSDDEDRDGPYFYKPSGNVIRPEPAPIRPSPKIYGSDGGRSSPPRHGPGKVGHPTNNIVKVTDYPKEAPPTEPAKPYGYGSDSKSNDSVKPYGSTYDPVKVKPPYGRTYESVKPYGSTYGSDFKSNNTDSVKPYTSYGSDYPVKPYSSYGSDDVKGSDSVKPYGTKNPNTSSTGQPVIDCYEAARRYNGKVIRT